MDTQQPTVCQVLHSLRTGGAEILAARLARQLRDSYRFVFACLDEVGTLGEELRDEGFAVHALGRRPGLDWRCSVRMSQVLRQEQVAVVHAHQYTPFFYSMTARLLYRRPAVLLTEHGRTFPDYPRRKRMLANRLLLQKRDRVVAVGEAVRQALIVNEGFPASRVEVIYNGIDLAPYTEHSYDREAVRRELGAGRDDLVLLYVARLDPVKDHATAIRALTIVRCRRPGARLVIVGEGPEEGALRELVRREGFSDHVRFLGLRRDVPRLLSGGDVLLLTSLTEGIPLTVLEGMAAGLPVVATNVGGVSEVVEDGVTGLLIPPGDPGAVAERVLRLAEDPGLRGRMGRLGRERAQAIFSEGQMVAAYDRTYRALLPAGVMPAAGMLVS